MRRRDSVFFFFLPLPCQARQRTGGGINTYTGLKAGEFVLPLQPAGAAWVAPFKCAPWDGRRRSTHTRRAEIAREPRPLRVKQSCELEMDVPPPESHSRQSPADTAGVPSDVGENFGRTAVDGTPECQQRRRLFFLPERPRSPLSRVSAAQDARRGLWRPLAETNGSGARRVRPTLGPFSTVVRLLSERGSTKTRFAINTYPELQFSYGRRRLFSLSLVVGPTAQRAAGKKEFSHWGIYSLST